MNNKIRFFSLFVLIVMLFSTFGASSALEIKSPSFDVGVKSAVLMEANTGTILYAKNESIPLPPASVTKIMTLLLVFEAIEDGRLKLDDMLTASENASSMGGSQIFLKVGEEMSVDDLIKSVIIASANDAAVTLAENIAGSIEGFVDMMNKRADELNMKNTHFENATGLDDTVANHLTSAYDIALMSKELIKHKKVSEYATIWMDTIRNGEFGLTNTNRLVRFYKGITGLKTGYTAKSGYCISATAKRGEMELIAVVMGAESSEIRNNCVAKLLDFGFANYKLYRSNGEKIENIYIMDGITDYTSGEYNDFLHLENISNNELKKEIYIYDSLKAPINKGEIIGKVNYIINGEIVAQEDIICCDNVKKISFLEYIFKVIENFL